LFEQLDPLGLILSELFPTGFYEALWLLDVTGLHSVERKVDEADFERENWDGERDEPVGTVTGAVSTSKETRPSLRGSSGVVKWTVISLTQARRTLACSLSPTTTPDVGWKYRMKSRGAVIARNRRRRGSKVEEGSGVKERNVVRS
jgi:hypothetical protein